MLSAARSVPLYHVYENIYIAAGEPLPPFPLDVHTFSTPEILYHSYCDDFGPMNAASIIDFLGIMDNKQDVHNGKDIVYVSRPEPRYLTNAVFLVGCYLILKLRMDPARVREIFDNVPNEAMEEYRDATYSHSSFRLSLLDCWQGLARAQSFKWIDIPDPRNPEPGRWGDIYIDEYVQYENPLNGNLTIIVPGKFVAFQGPEDLPRGQVYRDSSRKGRIFSPNYYIDIFDSLGVEGVVRLNEPRYNPANFESSGIAVHELEFQDCTCPTPEVVRKFLAIADTTPDMLAVHCKAGLGRTGTLIALYLIRSFGFTAREAMGWLRIMRPGSVIGEQQHYLCEVERIMHGSAIPRAPSTCPPPPRRGAGPPSPLGAAPSRHRSSLLDLSRAARQLTKKWSSLSDMEAWPPRPDAPPLAQSPRATSAADRQRALAEANESAAALASAIAGAAAKLRVAALAAPGVAHRQPEPLPGSPHRVSQADARDVANALARRAREASGSQRRL